VTKTATSNLDALKSEITRFREELTLRDELVQQLSQELFRMVKTNHHQRMNSIPQQDYKMEVQALREQLSGVEQQVRYYQQQLNHRDREIQQLRQNIRVLTERCRLLEQVVKELPKIYSQKFAERLSPIKDKIALMQQENRQLQIELQNVSERLYAKQNHQSPIEIPEFVTGNPKSYVAIGAT
jgi:chromosome segregation ATPase